MTETEFTPKGKKSIYDVYLDDYVVVNIKEISDNMDSLLELEINIQEQISNIKKQIAIAKAKAVTDGVYADPHWFRCAVVCIKAKGRQLRLIQIEVNRLRVKEKDQLKQQRLLEHNQKCEGKYLFYKTFHKECVKSLKPETVRLIMDRVRFLLKEDTPGDFLE